jgi:hypothetical protein
MKTNAERIAHRAAMREFKRQQIMSRAIKALTTSVESIKAADVADERGAIAESVEQCREWLTKSFAELARGDDADDEDRENEFEDDDGENHGDTTFRGLGRDDEDEDKERTKEKGMKDSWQSIVKQYGVIAVAKTIATDNDAHGLDEATLTQLATEHAKRLYPDMRADAAFAKLYSGADGIELRKAMQVVKLTPADLAPMFVGGEANRGGDVSPNNPKSALAQINALVEKQRERHPQMTLAQVFAAVYRDNPELARKEREENRPRGHPSYR